MKGEPDGVLINELSHKEGARILGKKYLLDEKDFPDGMAINNEKIELTTHTSTHLDSPYHFGPICEDNKAKRIKDIPLEWCFRKGVLLDLSKNHSRQPICKTEIEKHIKSMGIEINPFDIVLINTGADKYWNTPEYFTEFRGMSFDATNYLLDKEVKIIGIDSFGFDSPFDKMLYRYNSTKDNKELWPAHILGRKREYCHIERLANLIELSLYKEFYVSCFPVKLNTGAAWVRAVAIVKDKEDGPCVTEL